MFIYCNVPFLLSYCGFHFTSNSGNVETISYCFEFHSYCNHLLICVRNKSLMNNMKSIERCFTISAFYFRSQGKVMSLEASVCPWGGCLPPKGGLPLKEDLPPEGRRSAAKRGMSASRGDLPSGGGSAQPPGTDI